MNKTVYGVDLKVVISVAENLENVTIILDNAQIVLTEVNQSPLYAREAKKINLQLRGENKLYTTAYWGNSPGLWAPESEGSELIIENGETDGVGSLSTAGAAAWSGIGIANTTGAGSRITIKSGKITAYGGIGAAGIGASWGSNGYQGTITIEGGEVIAVGGDNGAGIGSGKADSGNNNYKGSVIITGGYIVATGGTNGAGIGGGYRSTFGDITIVGGYVRAIGVYQAPNIGGGTGSGGNRLMTQNLIIGSEVILADGTESSLHYQNGLVFDNTGQAMVKGNAVLPVDMTIGKGKTLTIPSETSLTVKEGVTLTNEGTMAIVGTLTNNGTIIQRSEDEIEDDNGSIIQQIALTARMIQLPSGPFVYNGQAHTPAVTITNSNQSFTTHYSNNINAGTASVTVKMEPTETARDLYGEATVTFTIQQASPDASQFTPNIPSSLTYDGTAKSVSAIYNGTQSSDGISIVYYNSSNEVLQSAPTDAGRYTFAIDLSDNHNFVSTNPIHDDNWQFEINQANPVFDDWNVQGRSYNGSAIENVTVPVLRGVTDEALSGVTLSYYYKQGDLEELTTPSNSGAEQEGAAPAWVGDYKVVATFAGNNNYLTKKTDATFSITKVYPSFSSIEVPQYAVYDGTTAFTATANVKGVVADETQYVAAMAYEKKNAAGEFEPLTAGALPKEAGEYRAIASFTDRNYMGINIKMPFSIQPKPLSATTATLDMETFTYNGTDQQPTVTEVKEGETTLVEGTDYTVTGPEESTDAGSYDMTITGQGNYQGTCTKAYTIEKATPTYTVPTGLTAIFGETLADVTLPSAEDGAWSWQAEETTSVGSVGENIFLATFTPTDVDNYKVVEDVKVTITVTEKGLDEETIQFERASITLMKGSTVPANALTKPADCTVTYSSDNEKVATVDAATGVVTVVGVGTTTITAMATGDYSGSASYSLTVTQYVPNAYTVTIPDHVTGAIIVGGGTRKVEENGEVTFRIELDPNGNGQYPTVTTSNGMTLTHDGNGNYRFQAMGDTQVMIGEVLGYSYYLLTLPQETVEESDSTFWSAEGIEVVGAAAVPAMRAVSDSETSRFMAPFGTMVTLRPIETAERKFLQWENGSTERERTLTLRADEEIRALWQKVSAVGIEEIAANSLIRGERGQLCIEVPVSCDAVIYSYNGVPVRMAHLTEGSNRIYSLPAGLYLVQIGHARAVAVRVR